MWKLSQKLVVRVVAVGGGAIGAGKMVSSKLDETRNELSDSLRLPYDAIADQVSHWSLSGQELFDQLRNTEFYRPEEIFNKGMHYSLLYTTGAAEEISKNKLPSASVNINAHNGFTAPDNPPLPSSKSHDHLKTDEEHAQEQKEALEKLEQEQKMKLEKLQKEQEEKLEMIVQEQREKEREARALREKEEQELLERQERIEKENVKLKDELLAAEDVANKSQRLSEENEALKSSLNSLKADSHKTETDLRKELLKLQESYKRELDKIRSENDKLKYMLKNSTVKSTSVKKSIIDMYADVLDTLSENDNNYKIQDHLPRIVVVGDQSSGKTSVLEMIIRARIFPRGHGEMMTRSPVQVTLGEGNRHTAQFNGIAGSEKIYDLSSETELYELRKEVERRMKQSIKKGETISSETIALTVKGPGLHRMVLVDLPGIISTETSGMRPNTKGALADMCSSFMRNPNAIILCVQDGSIDAERSNVTSIVQSHDPKGKRTIFVLTKVDLAEKNMANPTRVKKILEGKLFPMKALGYYAVVTGRGPQEDGIETIREYEEDFFSRSKLFKSGAFRASQMSTSNLSLAVSDCFWKMVGDSVEQQSDNFKAARYNLEAEWRNTFAGLREMDRNDLFEKAKDDILDDIAALHKLTPLEWETLLQGNLWSRIQAKVVDEIYLQAAECKSSSHFNTKVDIALKDWTDDLLPQISVEVGWATLFKQLQNIMQTKAKDHEVGDLFQPLKANILSTVQEQHAWQSNALKRLSVIQKNALEDTAVTNKMHWDNSISFMEQILRDRITQATDELDKTIGPSWTERWSGWRSRSPLELQCVAAKNELQKLLVADDRHGKNLENDELTTVRKNLQTQGVDVPYEIICTVWQKLYNLTFLNRALNSAQQCRKAFYHRNIACNAVECNDVVLFWRATRMLETTSNALRLQIMNTEAQRLEKEVKQYLEELSNDEEKKKTLITGKRVDLAEELRRVRGIQDKLDTFIEELKREQDV